MKTFQELYRRIISEMVFGLATGSEQDEEEYKKILKEYDENEREDLTNLLEKRYHNRRIILTKGDFAPKNYEQQHVHHKPMGSWYSLGYEWAVWLSREMPEWWNGYGKAYMLDLDYSNILRLNTVEKLEKFSNLYGMEPSQFSKMNYYSINWPEVSKKYKGIEIIPYQWEFRHISWYNSWDIASGCIWDSSAIKNYHEIHIHNRVDNE